MHAFGTSTGYVVSLATAALAADALSAAGQHADPPAANEANQPIIVIGRKPTPDEARRRAREFVRETGIAAGHQPVARWVTPVCPRIVGVARKVALRVEATMREIARDAGVPVATAPCRGNIAVVFTDNAGGLVRRIAARQPARLAEVPLAWRPSLNDGNAAVRWWYTTEIRTRDGSPAIDLPPPGASTGEGGVSSIPLGSGGRSLQNYNSSLVSTQMARWLTSATVVIDVQRAEGTPLDAVAAYAALVAYSEMKLDAAPSGDTILQLFANPGIGRDLSESDRTFLKSLYSLPLDRQARQQRGRIVRDLVADEIGN